MKLVLFYCEKSDFNGANIGLMKFDEVWLKLMIVVQRGDDGQD